jgi:hypothetical protein
VRIRIQRKKKKNRKEGERAKAKNILKSLRDKLFDIGRRFQCDQMCVKVGDIVDQNLRIEEKHVTRTVKPK